MCEMVQRTREKSDWSLVQASLRVEGLFSLKEKAAGEFY